MKIHDLELFLVAVGQSDSASPAHCLLVRVTTASGLEGWGESAGLAAGRTCRAARGAAGRAGRPKRLRHRGIAHAGSPLAAAVAVGGRDGRLGPAGPRVAAAAVQSAGRILSAAGARVGPVGSRKGGGGLQPERSTGRPRRGAPVVAKGLPTSLPQIARELAEQGFHTQTVVTGGKPDEDLQNLRAIREMVGDRIELRFDGLGRFDAETARDLCAGLEYEGLQFFLDPLNTPELHAVAALGRQTSVPLAAWRAIRGPADVLTAVRWARPPSW